MQQIIRIPEPCFENWHEMSPREQGRHCNACSKTVVDFTGWHPQEILFYLKANTGTCGRFRNDQLNVPIPSPDDFVQHIGNASLPLMKKVAAVFLFVFCIMAASCNDRPVVEKKEVHQTMGMTLSSIPVMENIPADSVKNKPKPRVHVKAVPAEGCITSETTTGGIPEFEPEPYIRDTAAVKTGSVKPVILPDTTKDR